MADCLYRELYGLADVNQMGQAFGWAGSHQICLSDGCSSYLFQLLFFWMHVRTCALHVRLRI